MWAKEKNGDHLAREWMNDHFNAIPGFELYILVVKQSTSTFLLKPNTNTVVQSMIYP